MSKILLTFIFSIFSICTYSQDSLQVMFYNLFRFPTSPPANRTYLLKDILDSIQPDLLMACEIVNSAGADAILYSSFSNKKDSFAMAQFHYSASAAGDPLQQMVYFNTRKLILVKQAIIPTTIRDINHYTFILNSQQLPLDSIYLEVFVTHLKSSDGSANKQLRLNMVDSFFKALAQIPTNHHVLFAGDFNFYDAATEPAYQKIIDTLNPIIMIDPLIGDGDWHDNPAYSAIHTQATRVSASGFGLGGATGGMDDRFDFIMMSENCRGQNAFYYKEDSYLAYGNNGNCLNKSVNDSSCTGIYSLALREKLFNMSDHLPVVMKFKTNYSFPIPTSIAPKKGKLPAIELINGNLIEDYLIFKLNIDFKFQDKLIIYNVLGQILKTKNLKFNSGIINLDVRDLKSGIYFLQLEKKKIKTIKFIKK